MDQESHVSSERNHDTPKIRRSYEQEQQARKEAAEKGLAADYACYGCPSLYDWSGLD